MAEKVTRDLGRGWHGNREGHAAAGSKGGTKVAEDRAHMSDIGKRGGKQVSRKPGHMSEIGKKGGTIAAANRAIMRETDRAGAVSDGKTE